MVLAIWESLYRHLPLDSNLDSRLGISVQASRTDVSSNAWNIGANCKPCLLPEVLPSTLGFIATPGKKHKTCDIAIDQLMLG